MIELGRYIVGDCGVYLTRVVDRIGDLVVVFQAGACGLTASPTAFLSHAPAREALV